MSRKGLRVVVPQAIYNSMKTSHRPTKETRSTALLISLQPIVLSLFINFMIRRLKEVWLANSAEEQSGKLREDSDKAQQAPQRHLDEVHLGSVTNRGCHFAFDTWPNVVYHVLFVYKEKGNESVISSGNHQKHHRYEPRALCWRIYLFCYS